MIPCRWLALLVIAWVAACKPASPEATAKPLSTQRIEDARPLNLETVNKFHWALARACEDYSLQSYYGGALGHSGRALGMIAKDQHYEWSISERESEGAADELQALLFTVRIDASGETGGFTKLERFPFFVKFENEECEVDGKVINSKMILDALNSKDPEDLR